MAYTFHERLSAMDAMFLEIEDANVHMHMGGVAIFEAAPLRGPEGGLDLDLVLAFGEAQLHKSPRLRQKLATIPWFDQPVWVDDPRFNLSYHVRHTALPPPGDERQLKRLAGRILSQGLDRNKPLWEMWLVEGLEGDRFAVVSKLHHCMADGMSSGDLSGLLSGTKPRQTPKPGPVWVPRAAPEAAGLVASEITHRATAPFSMLRGTAGESSEAQDKTSLGDAFERLGRIARGAARAAEVGLQAASETPLNVDVGPHRRFDWIRLDLLQVKNLGHAAGGKLNDGVLALVSGAVRRFFSDRGLAVSDLTFRVAVPVDVRTDADRGQLGNRVSSLVVELPIAEKDPWQRLLRVVETTSDLKGSGESQAVDLVSRLADLLPAGAMAGISRAGNRAVNMIVTNVPGPRQPIYMLTARMLESYPIVPLMANQALNIAIFSYEDGLFLGFLADWDAVPDLHAFVEAVPAELEALGKAALAHGHVDASAPGGGAR
jgi:diacylglycerol O-acyltransferase